jgi:Biopolymer transport protein ExbD/TolR.
MAELTTLSTKPKKYLHKSIRVDLTPMVDLGFLLITFFILTISIQQATVMKLTMPKDSEIKTLLSESTTLTFILLPHDSIGYYDGFGKEVKYAKLTSMRNLIKQKQNNLTTRNIDKYKLTLIIKPGEQSTYENFIDALDEITISDCKHYFID